VRVQPGQEERHELTQVLDVVAERRELGGAREGLQQRGQVAAGRAVAEREGGSGKAAQLVCGRSYLGFAVAAAPGACLAEATRRTMTCLMPSMRKPTRSMGLNAACTSGLASWRLMTWGCVTL